MKQHPPATIVAFMQTRLFKRFNGGSDVIEELDGLSFPHIDHAEKPDTAVIAQQRASEAINSLHPLTAIEGPPGTGKTHILVQSLLCRAWSEASSSKPQDVTVVATMTNLAGMNVALAFEKQGFTDFKFAVSESFYVSQSKADDGNLHRLESKKLLWRPSHLQSLNHQGNSKASQLHKKLLKGCRIIISTVSRSCSNADNRPVSCTQTLSYPNSPTKDYESKK